MTNRIRRGRGKVPKTIKISARIPTDLHKFMVKDGDANERTFSRELVFMLRKVIKNQGNKKQQETR